MATQDMLEFAIVLYKELPPGLTVDLGDKDRGPRVVTSHLVAELAHKLIRAASSLHKRYEAECSYEWADTDAYRKATERKEAAVRKLLAPYGIGVDFNGDPRGAPIKLRFASGLSNGWGNDGYCIPTREGR